MKKRMISICMALALLFAMFPQIGLCVSAGTVKDNGYADMVQAALADKTTSDVYPGYGALYDVDGNGVDELFLLYYNDGWEAVCSVYTLKNGRTIPLLEKEGLYYEAGAPWGFVGVVRENGQDYLATHSTNGHVMGEWYEHFGSWTLYAFDGAGIEKHTHVEYTCKEQMGSNRVDASGSSATIDGVTYGYDRYEEWEDKIETRFAVYPYADSQPAQYKQTMTLEDLLAYLREHPVEEPSVPEETPVTEAPSVPDEAPAVEEQTPIKQTEPPKESAQPDRTPSVTKEEDGGNKSLLLLLVFACVVFAIGAVILVVLIRRGKPEAAPCRCRHCGQPMEEHDAFCTNCGTAVVSSEYICPNCDSPVPLGSTFCGECGYKL